MAIDILESISSRQIQELHDDMSAMANGYQILTTVDTFDICEYCFPFGIETDEKVLKTMGQLGDEQFAYDFLFRQPIGQKPIVLSEYKLELFNVRSKILRVSQSVLNKKNNLEDEFIRPILDERNPSKRLIKIGALQNTLSFLIAYALFSQDSVTRFTSLLTGDFLIDATQLEDDVLTDVFSCNSPEYVTLFKSVFEEWVKVKKSQLQGIADKADLVNELNSVYKDVTAMVRVLLANERLRKAGEKRIVLLHSSTRERTESILRTAAMQNLQQDAGLEDLSFVRNKNHTFLLSLLWQNDQDKQGQLADIVSKLAELVTVGKTHEEMQQINSSYSPRVKPGNLISKSDQIINSARSAFEQSYLLSKLADFGKYQSQVEDLMKKLESDQEVEYGAIIDLYNKFLRDARRRAHDNSTELAIKNVKNVYALQLNISTLLKGIIQAKKIKVSKGGDMIRGSFHHLPFLIFLREHNFDKNAKKIMDPLIDYCLKPEPVRSLQTADILNVLAGFSGFEERFRETPTISLVSLFLMLLLPTVDKKNGGDSGLANEENALQNAESLLPIYERLKDVAGLSSIDYYRELRYILIWLYRRCQRYSESLQLAEACIGEYPDDPRFYHGKCLTLYSKYLSNDQGKFDSFEKVEEVTDLALLAVELYQAEKVQSEKITYTIGALLNTLAHLYCIRYVFTGEGEDLVVARGHYRMLQELFDGDKRPMYSDYPELLHTGAVLELSAARQERKAQNREGAIILLDEAASKINSALSMIPESALYLNLKADILVEGREIRRTAVKETKQSSKR
jgi:hypothetical protein